MPPPRGGSSVARLRRAAEVERPIASSLALPEQHVDQIVQSHERCVALGLSRIDRPDLSPLGRPDLNLARERNRRLHEHAAPVMEMLFDQIVNTQSMVVLCDATGTVIHSIGDDDFLARASKVALAPGANWSESAKGTNAVGTALVAEAPTLVHADEHFLHANHFLTCSAAPILDPRGNILGVLDVSGDHHSYHQHTMALVRMSARMIENHWLSDDHRDAMRLHFHSRVGTIGTLMEGILAVSPDGRIVGANRSALDQLGLSGAGLRLHSLASLFGTSVAALVDRFRSPRATPLQVQTGAGARFHLHARFDWPVWSHVAEAAAAAAPPPPAPAAWADAAAHGPDGATPRLDELDTGDPQLRALLSRLRRVRDRGIPILVRGETGTGKQRLARAMHADSARARAPFVALNCAAIPAPQLAAELFGPDDVGPAGTPCATPAGRILHEQGGTLFLDEIGELPPALQARLLSLLAQHEALTRDGRAAPMARGALVCASSRNLREQVDAQTFREDLYYRINGLTVRLPALRERSDLAVLAQRLLDGQAAGRPLRLADGVWPLFEHHPWPGNVRQLVNLLHAAVALLAADETVIGLEHLPEDFVEEAQGRIAPNPPGPAVPERKPAPPRSLQDLELDAMRQALQAAGGNLSQAARQLGISRNTVYRRLRWTRGPA